MTTHFHPEYDPQVVANAFGLFTGRLQKVSDASGRDTGLLQTNINAMSPQDTTIRDVERGNRLLIGERAAVRLGAFGRYSQEA